ncbi:MAG: flavodoxin family protein [Anaerolineae bacterium]
MPVKKVLRKLVLYFSHEGGTRHLAQAVANAAGADLVEIKTVKPLSTSKVWLMIMGGFQAMSGRKPEIQPLSKKAETYDLIYVGTPIWASRMAPAVRTWLAEAGLKGKRVALFASSGSGKTGRAFTDIRAALPDNTFSVDFVVKEPLKDKAASARLARDWARQVLKS